MHDIMSAREPTCLHDWRTANWIMIVAKATVSTKGANHDIMMKNRLHAMPWFGENDMNVMPVERILEKVTEICKKNNIEHLKLFGSFATGTATEYSDIDFVVYGCPDILKLERDMENVETLRKIDIFDYDSIRNKQLLEDIDLYGKQIY